MHENTVERVVLAHVLLVLALSGLGRSIVNRTYTEDRFQIPCMAGNKLVIIYDSGDVYPCEIIDTLESSPDVRERFGNDFKLGNVRDYDCDVRKILSIG